MKKELGDFQTPMNLVAEVIACLSPVGERWPRVLEPTCGSGNFIGGLIESGSPPREIQGIEIQEAHFARARQIAKSSKATRVFIHKASIFDLDLNRDIKWRESGLLLVIGNPPWITNSELGVLESGNLPPKSNLKNLTGMDAMTGSSNFDIAEFIWLKLIEELASHRPAIALLCKTGVARNVLQFAYDRSLPVSNAWIRRIDARKHFNAAVDACLLYVEVAEGPSQYEVSVFKDLKSSEPETIMGFSQGRMVADINACRETAFIDGQCPLTWRQGVKHDAAQVMELRADRGAYRNRLGEVVDVEADYVYPLLKSRELHNSDNVGPPMSVIIPQCRIGENTRELERVAPRLWRYLTGHSQYFSRRKSSIYRNQPPFAIFGIGDYSFASFKVGVSGFYKKPRFRLIAPVGGRAVMLDDTCYFVPCRSLRQAALVAALLNHQTALDFIRSAMFWDAKRPVTKNLLQRIDLIALLKRINRREIIAAAEREMEGLPEEMANESAKWPDDLSQLLAEKS